MSPGRSKADAPIPKPGKLEKGQRCVAIISGMKKRRLEVYVELADGTSNFGTIENSAEVPESIRSTGTKINVLVVQLSATGRVFRFESDVSPG